jgi:hypothetical protein
MVLHETQTATVTRERFQAEYSISGQFRNPIQRIRKLLSMREFLALSW